jgi:hypothetical protein
MQRDILKSFYWFNSSTEVNRWFCSLLLSLYDVDVGSVADDSEVHYASIIRNNFCVQSVALQGKHLQI